MGTTLDKANYMNNTMTILQNNMKTKGITEVTPDTTFSQCIDMIKNKIFSEVSSDISKENS